MLHHTNFKFKEPLEERETTTYIVLHHSRVTSSHNVKDVHQWHLNKKWAGIGYHYFVAKNGEIYEGRPHNTVGAHAYGFNEESIGICYEGDFNKERMTEKQADAAVVLLALLSLAYDDAKLCMHKELVKERSCPGKFFPFDRIKDKVYDCKKALETLFGVPRTFIEVNEEWRHQHDHLGDEEEERRRHEADDTIEIGNFHYGDILRLLRNVKEESY